MAEPDDRETVLALLHMSGLTPSVDEVDTMGAGYRATRAIAECLYGVPGVRYEDPAVTFDPRLCR